jgi:hypothetical protein
MGSVVQALQAQAMLWAAGRGDDAEVRQRGFVWYSAANELAARPKSTWPQNGCGGGAHSSPVHPGRMRDTSHA